MSTQGSPDTRTTSPAPWYSDYAQQFLNAGAQAAQQPYQPYTGPRVADLSPLQNQALGGFSSLGSAMVPYYQAAGGALNDIIGGNQNPYTQNVVDRTTRQVTDAYNQAVGQTSARFNSPGNFDSVRHDMRDEMNQRALSTGLGDAIGQINANAYDTMRNRQLQGISSLNNVLGAGTGALSTAIQAGDIPRQQLQQVYNTGYNDFTEQRDYPWSQLQRFGGLISGASGAVPQTQTTQAGSPDPISQGIGLWTLGSRAGSKGGQAGGQATDLTQLNQFGNMGPGTYG